MPRVSKKRKAARKRVEARKLIREAQRIQLGLPTSSSTYQPPLREAWDMLVQEDGVQMELPTNLKQEPIDIQDLLFQSEHLEEVKVEQIEPTDVELDPICQQQLITDRVVVKPKKPKKRRVQDLGDLRCQFCLKLLKEVGGRSSITRKRIIFVIGARRWGSPRERPNCCKDCKRMFDLFHEFKTSCLKALAQSRVMANCTKKNPPDEMLNMQPIVSESIESVDAQPEYECQICNVFFLEQWELETHLLTHDSTPVNKRRKSSDDSYNDTIEAQQPSNDAPEESNPETTEHSAADDKALPNLIPAPTAPKRKYCFRCKKFYESEAIYMEHRPTCTKPPRDPPPLACNQCPKRFNRQEHLTYHINQHNGIRTVPCRREGCTKMFFQPQVRQRHELTCGKEPELMCTKCASVFRSKSALSAHMATHGDPTFFCEKCTRGFYSKANLQKHYASHSDARNFECKTCGKRFKSHEANRVHQRIHTQEKPYVCPDCGMAFMYNCVLKTHQDKGQCAGPAAGLKDSFHQAAEDE